MGWVTRFGLWLAGWGGWTPCEHPDMVPVTEVVLAQVDAERAMAGWRAADAARDLAETACAAAEADRDKAQAVADAFTARYMELLRTHERLTGEITQIVAERDVARADFQLYAQQRLNVRPDLRVRAEYLVGTWHKKGAHLSGEHKRHQVYADLCKEFPDTPRRDLGLAIEMAVRVLT